MSVNVHDNPAVEIERPKMPDHLRYQWPVAIVNIAGSTKEALVQQKLNALHHLDAAMAAINQATPHGRDYQLQKPRELEVAKAYYRRMTDEIEAIRKAIEAEAEIINDQ